MNTQDLAIQALTHRLKTLEDKQAEKTAVGVLSERVRSLEKQLENCREAGRRLSAQLLAIMDEQSILKAAGKIRIPKGISPRSRHPKAVQYRYNIMRIMSENGMTDNEIAKEFGVDRRAAYHARKSGWKSKHAERMK
jgi:hypothetical protein